MAGTEVIGKHGGARKGAGRPRKNPHAPAKDATPKAAASPPPSAPPPARGVSAIEYADARAAHEYWKGQLAEQTFRKNEGDLLDRAQVEQGIATLFATITQTIRGWPDNVERTAGITPEVAEVIERMADGLCLTLQDKVREFGGGG